MNDSVSSYVVVITGVISTKGIGIIIIVFTSEVNINWLIDISKRQVEATLNCVKHETQLGEAKLNL